MLRKWCLPPMVRSSRSAVPATGGQTSLPRMQILCLKGGLTLWRRDNFLRISSLAGEGQTPFQTEPNLSQYIAQTVVMLRMT